MAKDNNDILLLRNDASLYIDDLVAWVVNSSLAMELRIFSSEIMELKPGFAFSYKQAKKLMTLSRRTLKQYQCHVIGDDKLMDFLNDAKSILKGNEQVNRRNDTMGIINKLLHGKELKKQQALDSVERDYKEVCNQIMNCEEEKKRCIDACANLQRDSITYRENARMYKNADNKLILLRKKEQALSQILTEANRVSLIEDFNKWESEVTGNAGILIHSEKDMAMLTTAAEMKQESLNNKLSQSSSIGEGLFTPGEETVLPDSDFDAQVAAVERRKTTMEIAGIEVPELEKASPEIKDEFDALVEKSKSNG